LVKLANTALALNKDRIDKSQVEEVKPVAYNPVNNLKGAGFKPGQSGNPNGRPKIPDDVRAMLKAACPKAIKILLDMVDDPKTKPDLRVKCIEIVMDRVYGRATQPIDNNITNNTIPQNITDLTVDDLHKLIDAAKSPAK